MKRISSIIVMMLVAAGLCAVTTGCKKKSVTRTRQQQQAEQPPPTVEQIVREVSVPLTPFMSMANDEELEQEEIDQMRAKLSQSKSVHRHATEQNPNGPKALIRVANQIEDTMTDAREQRNWHKMLYGTILLETLIPDHLKIRRYRQEATIQINRPLVKMTATFREELPEDEEQLEETVVFLTLYLPDTKETLKVTTVEGEEFLEGKLTLLEIIGNNKGVRLLYHANNEVFEVYR